MNKPKVRIKVLGIDPGTRETGFAVVGHAGLMDYGVKNFTHRKTKKRLLADAERWLVKLVAFHRPKVLVVEKTDLTRLKKLEKSEISHRAHRASSRETQYQSRRDDAQCRQKAGYRRWLGNEKGNR